MKLADINERNKTNEVASYKICVCIPDGQLFLVPAPHRCDEANEQINPCSAT